MARLVKAAFGAGCFWQVEEVFAKIPGVASIEVGYMGGTTANPTYIKVCIGLTGHAETVLVTFDPAKVKYKKLLEVFWKNHDPIQMNKQGPDVGTQYRSVIFYFNPAQEKEATLSKNALQKKLGKNKIIATQITKAKKFNKAEEYHQKYLQKKGKGFFGFLRN